MKDFLGEGNMLDALSEWPGRLYAIGSMIAELGSHESVDLHMYSDALGGIIRDYSKAIEKVLDSVYPDIQDALNGEGRSVPLLKLIQAHMNCTDNRFPPKTSIEEIERALRENDDAIQQSHWISVEVEVLNDILKKLRDGLAFDGIKENASAHPAPKA